MTPNDLLDEFDDTDLAPLTNRQRRRVQKAQAKAVTRAQRAEKKRAYHRKVAETRNSPVRGGVLAVLGIIFFGGLWIIGTVSQNNEEARESEPVPMLSYAPPSGDGAQSNAAAQSAANDADNAPERFAENAMRNIFLDATTWPNYVDPIAERQVDEVRRSVLAIAEGNALTIREVEWVETQPNGHEWVGTAHVRFSEATTAIAINVTLDYVDDTPRVVQLDGMEPIG